MNQSKVKRIIQNFIGASASVAVVTTVAATNVNIEANFIQVTLIENRAYYELNVVEPVVEVSDTTSEAPTPMVAELRLNVSNQWDNFSYPLTFGFNAGWIEPLRPQQAYNLAIEVNQGNTWRTLATYPLSARILTTAVIDSLDFMTTPLSQTGTIVASVSTQVGSRPVDRWEGLFAYGNRSYPVQLPLGKADIEIANIEHMNAPLTLTVKGYQASEVVVETTSTIAPMPYVNSAMTLSMPNLTTLDLEFNLDNSFTNAQYGVTLTDTNNVSLTYPIQNKALTIDHLQQGEAYTLSWWLAYGPSLNNLSVITLSTQTINVLLNPVYVLSLAPLGQGTIIRLSLENNLNLLGVFLSLNNAEEPLPLTLIETTDAIVVYELYLLNPLTLGTILTFSLIQAEPHAYPINFLSFTFQGGNER